ERPRGGLSFLCCWWCCHLIFSRVASNNKLDDFDEELKRTFHQRRRELRFLKYQEDPPPVDMEAQDPSGARFEETNGVDRNYTYTKTNGALPSDTHPNPKAQVNVVTLINGKALDEMMPQNLDKLSMKKENGIGKTGDTQMRRFVLFI
ncbi:hypothetical protein HAX54_035586, partial [Datura stramonium]|nr:hypothetical protein [Datura stramonium]